MKKPADRPTRNIDRAGCGQCGEHFCGDRTFARWKTGQDLGHRSGSIHPGYEQFFPLRFY
jgi:hypothetical protein